MKDKNKEVYKISIERIAFVLVIVMVSDRFVSSCHVNVNSKFDRKLSFALPEPRTFYSRQQTLELGWRL